MHTHDIQSNDIQPHDEQPHVNCECDICLRNLVKYYDGVSAVNDASFHLMEGEIVALLGPSGCGKTTTLRLIAGFEKLDAGEIEIGQKLVAAHGLHLQPEQRRVGMVFQEFALFPHLDVAQNVRFGLHKFKGNKDRRVHEVLELVGLPDYGNRMPHELSGGQQQRVALARALAPEPHLILMDEPFSNLDASLRSHVRAEVRSILREANATAIFVTHDQEEALSMVDNVVVMLDGQVHQVASPHNLYYQPASRAVASFVGEANFLPGTAAKQAVECELGTFDMMVPCTGNVDVMIRPENIIIRPGPSDSPCRVRNVLFFGHDQLITVELNSGTTLDARAIGPLHRFSIGQPVQVETNGPVMAYAR